MAAVCSQVSRVHEDVVHSSSPVRRMLSIELKFIPVMMLQPAS